MTETRRGAGSRTSPAQMARASLRALTEVPWVPFAAALLAFAVDMMTPRPIIDFYIIPILLCLRARSPRIPLYAAALCTPLMAIGYELSPEIGSSPTVSRINLLSMLIIVWGGALMIASLLKVSAAAAHAKQQLEEADQRKDEFLAMLSHELRNPLAPIRTAADILETATVTAEQLRWAGGMIRRQAVRMAGLLDDLFDVARIAEGKLALSLQLTSFSSIIDAAIEVAGPALDRKSHRLTVSLPAEPTMLQADPLRLSQVFSNLLTNAAKYTDPRGHIDLTAVSGQGSLRVSIRDNGIGIPAEALTRVFTLFSQMEGTNARAEGGMGIGLALAKGIVDLHGGAIEAQSGGRGRGSEFIVTLPLADTPAATASSSDVQRIATNGDGCRVLIADDNKDAADSLAALLAVAGHELRVTYDGLAALSAARDFHPQVALLDIDMPGLDGYALAEALRAEPWASQLTLVAITGWGNPQSARRAESAGFEEHLVKPVDPERIKALLRDRQPAARAAGAADREPHPVRAPNRGAKGGGTSDSA